MSYTPLNIRSRFENGTPDRFLAFFEAVKEIMQGKTTCRTYKLQKIGALLDAAVSGEERWAERHNVLSASISQDTRPCP